MLCPGGTGRIEYAVPWLDPGEDQSGESDYFHACATVPGVSTPDNTFGFQVPHSGEAYAGLYAFHSASPDYREYIMVPLATPLLPGKCYRFSMQVSLANVSRYAISSLGVHFSDTALLQTNWGPAMVTPQLDGVGALLADTADWMGVSGDYVAQGGEMYMTIGNFHDDASTTGIVIDGTFAWYYSYYYFDDVSLVRIDEGYGTAAEFENQLPSVSIAPNPMRDQLLIRTGINGTLTLILHDAAGRCALQEKFNNELVLSVGNLPPGIYACELRDQHRTILRRRVIKQ